MKSGIFSKFLIALIIAANIVFTIIILSLFLQTGSEPSTLIISWFGFTTGELWAIATIKKHRFKTKKNRVSKDDGLE